MILTDLKINQLRTLSSVYLPLHSRFNFIVGPNGSGKTSVLEALYLLSCGHSFRSREIASIISYEQKALTIFARSQDNVTISIQKSTTLPTQIKLNNQFCTATSQLAYALPCQIIYADIFQIIDAGSSVRRAVLDWGLFHVKPKYLGIWKEYKRVLKQRNALLKQSVCYDYFVPWDKQLSSLAVELDIMRHDYFIAWHATFQRVLNEITSTPCTLEYYKGWDKKCTGKTLDVLLAEHFQSDKQRQYTQYGAHHADIFIHANDQKAKRVLSRGQQKTILIALKLAQGALLNSDCLYLFDDLPAELDEIHQKKLVHYLMTHKGQYIIAATNSNPLTENLLPTEYNTFVFQDGALIGS